ncbi:MAG: hypothetical protein ACPGVO_11885 [Spirulinaceae cyanobacterium]
MQNLFFSTLLTVTASLAVLHPSAQAEPPATSLQPMRPTNLHIFEDVGGQRPSLPILDEDIFGEEEELDFLAPTVPNLFSAVDVIKNKSIGDIMNCLQATSSIMTRCYDSGGNNRVVINPSYPQPLPDTSFYGDELINYQLGIAEDVDLNFRTHPSGGNSSMIFEIKIGID